MQAQGIIVAIAACRMSPPPEIAIKLLMYRKESSFMYRGILL